MDLSQRKERGSFLSVRNKMTVSFMTSTAEARVYWVPSLEQRALVNLALVNFFPRELGMEHIILDILGKCCVTELHSQLKQWFLIFFSETGFHFSVAPAVLELALRIRLALNSEISATLMLRLKAEIKSWFLILNTYWQHLRVYKYA